MKYEDILEYEVTGTWWISYVWWDWGQRLIAKYCIWKSLRKYKRYLKFKRQQYEL